MIKDIKNNVICNEGSEYTVLQFWAEWCGPCQMLKPIVESVSSDSAYKDVSFQRINIDENPQLSNMMDVQSIPTIIVLKNQEETNRLVGFRPQPRLVMELNEIMKG